MAIQVECGSCFREYQVKDKFAGKVLPCKDCGAEFRVPRRRRPADAEYEDYDDGDDYPTRRRNPPRRRSRKRTFNLVPFLVGGSILAAIGVVATIGFVVWKAIDSGGGETPAVAGDNPNEPFDIASSNLPNFPDLGPPIRQLPDGTQLHFVDLSRAPQSDSGPGTAMKMRVYLPRGSHQPASIPCVLVAPAGTNLLVGNDMDASDYHDETLPYAQAGMAVVFYSIDGGLRDSQNASDAEYVAGYKKFRAAGAGVVNGRNALEYVLAKVPQVDPSRIYCAGHSSAGTLSLLLAQHEPRLRACIAYAPATDVEKRLEEATSDFNLRRLFPGLRDFVKQSSPMTHCAQTKCPVFLFQALDDSNVPASDTTRFSAALRRAGKSVTYRKLGSGGHYQPMIDSGISQAIAWLQSAHGATTPGFSPQSPAAGANPTTVAGRSGNRGTPKLPVPMKPIPRGPDPSALFPKTPSGVGGQPIRGKVVMFSVLAYNGSGDATAAARQALAGVSWAKANEVTYNAKTKTIVVPMRGNSLNTGPAKASLQRAGFTIGFTRMMSGGR